MCYCEGQQTYLQPDCQRYRLKEETKLEPLPGSRAGGQGRPSSSPPVVPPGLPRHQAGALTGGQGPPDRWISGALSPDTAVDGGTAHGPHLHTPYQLISQDACKRLSGQIYVGLCSWGKFWVVWIVLKH